MPRVWLVGALIVGLVAGLGLMRWRDEGVASRLRETSFLSMSSGGLQAVSQPLRDLGLPQPSLAREPGTDMAHAVELAVLANLVEAEMTPPPTGVKGGRQLALLVEVVRSLPRVAARYGSYTAGGRLLTAKERLAASMLGRDLEGLHYLSTGISGQLLGGREAPSAEWAQMESVLKQTLADMARGDH